MILAACGPSRYTLWGARNTLNIETFESSSEALQNRADILNKITPTVNPVHGTALVLVPSAVEINKNYIRSGFNAIYSDKEQIDSLIKSGSNYFQFIADAIQKRRIFDSVAVEHHNGNLASVPFGDYDFMVIADVDGWTIRSKATPRPLSIAQDKWDKSNSDSDARIISFLNLLSQQAAALCSK